MNKFRVTCLSSFNGEVREIFATRFRFRSYAAAKSYADTVSPDRSPRIITCDLFTNYDMGHWTVYDPDEYDGPGGEVSTLRGLLSDEYQAVEEHCELFDREI